MMDLIPGFVPVALITFGVMFVGKPEAAARLLDTTERVLNYKVRKYAIDARRFTA